MKKIANTFFSTRAAGLYIVLFALSIGVATFIENDYGTSSAQKVVYRSLWFEVLLLLFAISLVVNVIRFRMIQNRKWAILTFHVSILIILLGAGITRYFGSEGIMHIREGNTSNFIISTEMYLKFEVQHQENQYRFEEEVFFATLGKNKLSRSYQLGSQIIEMEVKDFIPNPTQVLEMDENGVPILKMVTSAGKGRETYYLTYNQQISIYGQLFSFGKIAENAINIQYEGQALFVQSSNPLMQMQMASQKLDTLEANTRQHLLIRSLYTNDLINFVITEFQPKGKLTVVSGAAKMRSESLSGIIMNVKTGNQQKEILVYGQQGVEGKPEEFTIGDIQFSISYGSKEVRLPFSIQLHDFIMERYPGTNSASSYASEVTLLDPEAGLEKPFRIYMNHILNYQGYRFFQSSYDQDELGTVLSVNHDAPGTWITYLGYFLLTLGMVFTLFSKQSRFYSLSKKLKNIGHSRSVVILILLFGFVHSYTPLKSNDYPINSKVVASDHAKSFGNLVVQDHRGRFKPINTMSGEVLRKLSRKEKLYGQSADQIFLGMSAFPEDWAQIPLIKIGKHEKVRNLLQVEGRLAAYNDFFKPEYILREHVRAAYSMEAKDRSVFEKEIIKIDERVNICNMIFTGRMVRLYPDPQYAKGGWISPGELIRETEQNQVNPFVAKFYMNYLTAVSESTESGAWDRPDQLIQELGNYQTQYGSEVIPSQKKVNLEIWLNRLNVFGKLGKYYGLLGLLILGMFFTLVFKQNLQVKWPLRVALSLLGLCFVFHTIGLGLRWYVSGHAPWSNGYESMIYIAWTTILAGMLFARKSLGGLAATSILSATILMVAGLSWLDPEITPLVPVLKSYWLTIHVSLEAGSYGFLMLGALIGVLNLILMIFTTGANQKNVYAKIKELTYISEMTLIGGLFMICIGTYLGGVWANESWGRYWGWDAKETWALVTILVYAFILHMRFIPGLRGVYAFNLSSLFGFASVMMTYFGVNYYLSGLHSYAAGDPVPIPSFVYYTVIILFAISILAFWKHRRFS